MEPPAGRVEQHFGNAEAADGGLLFQGNVRGDVHIRRKLSPKRSAIYPTSEPTHLVDPG